MSLIPLRNRFMVRGIWVAPKSSSRGTYGPGGVTVMTWTSFALSARINPLQNLHIEKSSFRTRTIFTGDLRISCGNWSGPKAIAIQCRKHEEVPDLLSPPGWFPVRLVQQLFDRVAPNEREHRDSKTARMPGEADMRRSICLTACKTFVGGAAPMSRMLHVYRSLDTPRNANKLNRLQ